MSAKTWYYRLTWQELEINFYEIVKSKFLASIETIRKEIN